MEMTLWLRDRQESPELKKMKEFLELSFEDMKEALVDIHDADQFARLQGMAAATRNLLVMFVKPMFNPKQEQ